MHFNPQLAAKSAYLLALVVCSLNAAAMPSTLAAQTRLAPDSKQGEARKLADRPADILRAGKIKVDVLDAVLPPRAMELGVKMQKAMEADPTYFLKAVQKAKPGEPLPYDPHCGLTKEEYAEFLKLFDERKIAKVAEAEIEIKEKSPSVFVFDGGESLPDLTGIEIDLDKDEVRTRIGTAKKQEEYATSADAPIGKCTGVEWSSEKAGSVIRVSISRQHASGKGCVYFRVMSPTANPPAKIRRVICFDTADTKSAKE